MSQKEKVLQALTDMASKIERDSKHIYRNPETGEMYQGVTSVSSIIPKDWLAQWGAKEAVKALGYSDYEDTAVAQEMWRKIKTCKSVQEYMSILKEVKGAGGRKSKQAMVDGKAGHLWLETYIQTKIDGQSKVPPIPNSMLVRPITQFLEWEMNNVDSWYASESMVVRPDKRYAGQLDAIAQLKNGFVSLIDFKFATNISEDYYLQTAGYSACFEPYGILFDQRIIIRLPKTLEKEEWNEEDHKYVHIPNDVEVRVIPTQYEVDRDAFFHALPVKGWINYVLKLSGKQVFKETKEKPQKPVETTYENYPEEKSDSSKIPF